MTTAALPVHYDPALVVLSVAIAVFASFTSLDLTGRIKAAHGLARRMWLTSAAVAMGGGIWSMHFVAMLAFSIDLPMTYDIAETIASLLVAIAVTGFGLFLLARRQPRLTTLLLAGTVMGIGVASMHYTGMAALRCAAAIDYDPILVALSIAIAIIASVVALWLAFTLQIVWQKIAAAFVMGAAIAGMHYTAMAAASFQPDTTIILITAPTFSGSWLATGISVVTFVVLAFALYSSTVDRRFAAHAEHEASALKQSEQRLRALIQNGAEIIGVLDRVGRFTFVSASAQRILGYELESLIGRSLPDLAKSGEGSKVQMFLDILKRQAGESVSAEFRLSHADGDYRDFEVVGNNLLDNRSVGGLVVNLHDITQRNHSQRELHAAMLHAEAANRTKSEFLANMSHELRTPLNAIIGFSSIIAEALYGPVGDPRYSEYADDIRRSGNHLLRVINDILDLTKAEAGRFELHEDMVDVQAAIATSISTVREPAERNGVTITINAPGDLPPLRADEGKLRQILINLLSNAVKFTPTGGAVIVGATVRPELGYCFVVRDSGIGMRPEDVPVAFEPFRQIDSRLSRKYDGTGLGLPLTKRLVELHGGTIEITTAEGAGTTATVIFPIARAALHATDGLAVPQPAQAAIS